MARSCRDSGLLLLLRARCRSMGLSLFAALCVMPHSQQPLPLVLCFVGIQMTRRREGPAGADSSVVVPPWMMLATEKSGQSVRVAGAPGCRSSSVHPTQVLVAMHERGILVRPPPPTRAEALEYTSSLAAPRACVVRVCTFPRDERNRRPSHGVGRLCACDRGRGAVVWAHA